MKVIRHDCTDQQHGRLGLPCLRLILCLMLLYCLCWNCCPRSYNKVTYINTSMVPHTVIHGLKSHAHAMYMRMRGPLACMLACMQEGSPYEHPAPSSTFASMEFSANFFKSTACFRADQSQCYPEGHEYHEVRAGGALSVSVVGWSVGGGDW